MDVPMDVVVVAWDKRELWQRQPAGVLAVYFPPAPKGATDWFTLCAAVAVAQAESGSNGEPTNWVGAEHGYLDRVVSRFNWKCSPNSRDTYWSQLPRGEHNGRVISECCVVGDEPVDRLVAQEYARLLFSRISGFVLGDPTPDTAGMHCLPRIEFRCSEDSQRVCDEFCELARGLMCAGQPTSGSVDSDSTPSNAQLKQHVIDFGTFMADRTNGFVGRQFVFDEISDFIRGAPSGYFVVSGLPGVGKSALLSHFVQEQQLPVHHFNTSTDGITSASDFLRNVCARLIAAYELPYPVLPDGFDHDGKFFKQLLAECAEKATRETPVVIPIDALDETDASSLPQATNCLFLPSTLPEHVYIIATSRPRTRLRLDVATLKPFELRQDDERNLGDVRTFLQNHVSGPRLRQWLADHELQDEVFIERMLEKSEGNFMYLRHVLLAIQWQELDWDDLPDGLSEYYERHWAIMLKRTPDLMENICRPILCVLAAFGEPVSLSKLADITSLELHQVGSVIRDWAEFVQVVTTGATQQYRLYHATFSEFLEVRVDPGLQTFSRMITDYYLRQAEVDPDNAPEA